MRPRSNARVRALTNAADLGLEKLSALLNATFPDPNTVLGLDRMQEFLSADPAGNQRRFCVLVAEDGDNVVGGTVFSYVYGSNCGFSEYIVADSALRGTGLGRVLFDARKAVLDAEAETRGRPGCFGVFIEVDNPERTPTHFAEAEGETALELRERLRLFDHLGFRRVDISYVQPPLAPGKQAIDYMDLLFAQWHQNAVDRIPADWIFQTVEVVWSAWTPTTFAAHLAILKRSISSTEVLLGGLGAD